MSHHDYLARFLPPTDLQSNTEPTCPQPQGDEILVEYLDEGGFTAPAGNSILDISRHHHIPHVASCGGVGRCSTCRVEVVEGLSHCAPRNEIETRMARAKGFPNRIRLACQTRVHGPVRLKRLLFDDQDALDVIEQEGRLGIERELAVLFCDVRSFTPFVESHLAYDVVHLLNRYFNTIGEPIHAHYGYIDKYIGDGIMVLFGLNPEREIHPCVDAVNAALAMVASLKPLNAYCCKHFQHHFRIGVGVHYGPVIVGEIGFRHKRDFTALGDVVNTAARIESMTKTIGATILVSSTVKNHLPKTYQFGQVTTVELKGKSGSHELHEIVGQTPTNP